MFFVYLLLIIMVSVMVGIFVGSRLRYRSYNGVIIVNERPEGMTYRIELAGDPELLAFQDVVVFKVVPPDYENLLSRDKLGV